MGKINVQEGYRAIMKDYMSIYEEMCIRDRGEGRGASGALFFLLRDPGVSGGSPDGRAGGALGAGNAYVHLYRA